MTPETTRHRFTLDELQQADDWSEGFCLACRAPRDCCEPDASAYPCDECGEPAVYGPHWIAIADLFKGHAAAAGPIDAVINQPDTA